MLGQVRQLRHLRIAIWIVAFVGVWLVAAQATAGTLRLAGFDSGQDATPVECGRRLSSVSAERLAPRSIRVVIATDEEWGNHFGDRADSIARSLVSDVSGLYRDVGLHLLPVLAIDWSSPDELVSAEELLDDLSGHRSLDSADILIGLTGQRLPEVDGFAEVGGQIAVVGHHRGAQERDVFVLAHEIGHLFGAHHGCDVPGVAGVMAKRGFEDPLAVCPCTRLILEANVTRFHEG